MKKKRASRLGGPRVFAGGREHHGAPLVRLRHGVVLQLGAAVLGLHGRVSVDAELRYETLEHPEEAALVEEVRRRQGDETLRPEGGPLCNGEKSVSLTEAVRISNFGTGIGIGIDVGIMIGIGIGIGIDVGIITSIGILIGISIGICMISMSLLGS